MGLIATQLPTEIDNLNIFVDGNNSINIYYDEKIPFSTISFPEDTVNVNTSGNKVFVKSNSVEFNNNLSVNGNVINNVNFSDINNNVNISMINGQVIINGQIINDNTNFEQQSSSSKEMIKIEIYLNKLVKLNLHGSSNVSIVKNNNSDNNKLEISSLEFNLNNKAKLSVDSDINTDDFSLSCSGVSKFKTNNLINVKNNMKINLSGTSSVKLDKVETHKIRIKQSGTTSINCERIDTNKLNANISGVSQTNFNLKGNDVEKLSLDLSGVSSFNLKNTYKLGDINTSGISKFNK